MPLLPKNLMALAGLVLACLCFGSGCATRVGLPRPTGFIAQRLHASNERDWRVEQSRLAWAEVDGSRYTLRNIRNNKYVTADQFVPSWYDRQIDLSQIQSVDYVVVPFQEYPSLAHTMLSFGVADGSVISISAEVRKEKDEDYSVFKGLGREYELMYVVGDERDLVRLRAIHRNDDVYIFPTVATPQQSQQLFAHMIARTNRLAAQPEFYNTLTNNCTTNIRQHINELKSDRVASAWQVVLPGHSDRYAYDLGLLDQRIPFEDLKQVSHVSELAREFAASPQFSTRIRSGRVLIDRIAARQEAFNPILNGQGQQYLERIELR